MHISQCKHCGAYDGNMMESYHNTSTKDMNKDSSQPPPVEE